jgi:putative transposase
MGYDPDRHHRRSIRLPDWDYSQAGAYFVTIVTDERRSWFDQAALKDIVETEWANLLARFPQVGLDGFVVMPNHVHFVVWLNPPDVPVPSGDGARDVGAQFNCAPTVVDHAPTFATAKVDKERPALGQVVRAFKAVISRRVRLAGTAEFAWQRNYYERIIRNERELAAIREYIQDNPAHWEDDLENPCRQR